MRKVATNLAVDSRSMRNRSAAQIPHVRPFDASLPADAQPQRDRNALGNHAVHRTNRAASIRRRCGRHSRLRRRSRRAQLEATESPERARCRVDSARRPRAEPANQAGSTTDGEPAHGKCRDRPLRRATDRHRTLTVLASQGSAARRQPERVAATSCSASNPSGNSRTGLRRTPRGRSGRIPAQRRRQGRVGHESLRRPGAAWSGVDARR